MCCMIVDIIDFDAPAAGSAPSAPATAAVLTNVRRFTASSSCQTPNELPQPHVFDACGLLKTKPFPFRPSLKSRTVPLR